MKFHISYLKSFNLLILFLVCIPFITLSQVQFPIDLTINNTKTQIIYGNKSKPLLKYTFTYIKTSTPAATHSQLEITIDYLQDGLLYFFNTNKELIFLEGKVLYDPKDKNLKNKKAEKFYKFEGLNPEPTLYNEKELAFKNGFYNIDKNENPKWKPVFKIQTPIKSGSLSSFTLTFNLYEETKKNVFGKLDPIKFTISLPGENQGSPYQVKSEEQKIPVYAGKNEERTEKKETEKLVVPVTTNPPDNKPSNISKEKTKSEERRAKSEEGRGKREERIAKKEDVDKLQIEAIKKYLNAITTDYINNYYENHKRIIEVKISILENIKNDFDKSIIKNKEEALKQIELFTKDKDINFIIGKNKEYENNFLNNKDKLSRINPKENIDIIILPKEIKEIKSLIKVFYDLYDYCYKNLSKKDFLEFCRKLQDDFKQNFKDINQNLIELDAQLTKLKAKASAWYNDDVFYEFRKNKILNILSADKEKIFGLNKNFKNLEVTILNKLHSDPSFSKNDMYYGSSSLHDSIIDRKNNLETSISSYKQEIEVTIISPFPYFKIIASAIVVLLLGFGFYVYIMAWRRKKQKEKKISSVIVNTGTNIEVRSQASDFRPQTSDFTPHTSDVKRKGSIIITPMQPTVEHGKGLTKVREKVGLDYYEINMSEIWDDTMVKLVYFNTKLINKIYDFFSKSLSSQNEVYETGGYIIGSWDHNQTEPAKYDVSLEDFIEPGDDAIHSEYELNFGAKIGIRLESTINNYKEKLGKNYIMTAWIHSHPGLKIFLSNHDVSVHDALSVKSHKSRLIALVVDTKTEQFDMGIFSYKSNGAINTIDKAKKLIKLDELRIWTLKAKMPILDSYFRINVSETNPQSALSNIYLSNESIINLDLIINQTSDLSPQTSDPTPQTSALNPFWLCKGSIINKEIPGNTIAILEQITRNEQSPYTENSELIGILTLNKKEQSRLVESTRDLIRGANPDLSVSQFIIVYNLQNTEINIFTRDKSDESHQSSDFRLQTSVLFNTIKNWTRRRR